MMIYTRNSKEIIQKGVDANSLLNNKVFFEAVSNVLTKYSELEEMALTDPKWDSRETTAQVRKYAMLRRATLDIVNELNDFVMAGQNTAYEEE